MKLNLKKLTYDKIFLIILIILIISVSDCSIENHSEPPPL